MKLVYEILCLVLNTGDNGIFPTSEYHRAERLIEEPSKEEVKIPLGKLKHHKPEETNHNIPSELI